MNTRPHASGAVRRNQVLVVGVAAVAAVIAGAGCGTIAHLEGGDGRTYLGTRTDVKVIRIACRPRTRAWHIPTVFDLPFARPVFFCVAVLDIPVSLVSDTLLLPYDFYLRTQSELAMLVTDEKGVPVPGARFVRDHRESAAGFTDESGVYRWPLHSTGHMETYVISKPGYYDTVCRGCAGLALQREMALLAACRASGDTAEEVARKQREALLSGYYPPTDNLPRDLVIPVVLKSIRDPVPMVGRRIYPKCPKGGGPTGFDLGVGDWVAPDGKGLVTDIVVRAETRPPAEFVRVEWSFPGEGNGIQSFTAPYADKWDNRQRGSSLIPPHVAPDGGYTNAAAFWVERDKYRRSSEGMNRNYVFRVRTRRNTETGRAEANVGWIRGNVSAHWGRDYSGGMSFEYYFNPDPTSVSLEATKDSPFTDVWSAR